ncbi:Androgen-induced gene 1 protein [Eumeta japonica]|uniref:Androgen-induced gene 1 protein n=1 Tax=Eumeta variegata TaxID=151549 RepID=A0A4C1W698_EUMVA|nr:Androgen-induced gene 1 protein [Eumeta japonica]
MEKLLFHLSIVAINCYAIWYDQQYIEVPLARADAFVHLPMKGRSIFFTMWCFLAQTLYFAVSAINDIFGTDEESPKKIPLIRSIRDVIFTTLALPASMYVTTVFWSIYAIDRELILPSEMDKAFPSWLNHLLHTTVLLFTLIEMHISPHTYPSRKMGVFIVTSFSYIYFVWMMYVYYETSTWVYPLFDVLNWPTRIFFCLSTVISSAVMYYLGEKLNAAVWSDETPKEKVF